MVTVVPGVTVVPVAGETIAADGAVVSVEAEAAVRLGSSEPGWARMSAKRFTVACCMRGSAVEGSRSWLASSPQDHCTVPAPKTSAPPPARESVRLCVALPGPEGGGAGAGGVGGRAGGGAPVAVGGAVALRAFGPGLGGRGGVAEPGGPRAVVEVRVPLVAQRAVRQRRLGARRQSRDAGVAP